MCFSSQYKHFWALFIVGSLQHRLRNRYGMISNTHTLTLPHIHIILITLIMSAAFNCIAQSSLFLSPRKCGFYKHLTVESGFKRLLTSSGMSTLLWSLSCGSRGMQHMSCLDFRATRRDTVHTSCPCPHPGEHTPITSKEFERVKRVKREREICAQCEKESQEISRTKGRVWKDTGRTAPCSDCMQNVCDCGWKGYTKI